MHGFTRLLSGVVGQNSWQSGEVSPRTAVGDNVKSSRERILERAIEVLSEFGEAGIRTNIIAQECGVTAPILYRAFGNREGLIIAAQAERYLRATTEAARFLCARIENSTSRDDLYEAIGESLDFIMAPKRSVNRRLRATVIGSSISRPALQQRIAEIDRFYVDSIVKAYAGAVEKGWVSPRVDLGSIALWAISITNGRLHVEFEHGSPYASDWDLLSKEAIMRAIFGD